MEVYICLCAMEIGLNGACDCRSVFKVPISGFKQNIFVLSLTILPEYFNSANGTDKANVIAR